MADSNPNSRLEAFCDGVFAFALTLLIVDIKIPASTTVSSTTDLWRALQDLAPSVYAFVLSFAVILITWVNHHSAIKLVNKSSPAFIYANGFLLLTVVFMPFPTALAGEYLFTDHASPAVMLYSAVIVVQSIGWVLVSGAAIKDRLMIDEKATRVMIKNRRIGIMSAATYTVLAVIALWFPQTIAVLIAAIWIFWLGYGIRMKHE